MGSVDQDSLEVLMEPLTMVSAEEVVVILEMDPVPPAVVFAVVAEAVRTEVQAVIAVMEILGEVPQIKVLVVILVLVVEPLKVLTAMLVVMEAMLLPALREGRVEVGTQELTAVQETQHMAWAATMSSMVVGVQWL